MNNNIYVYQYILFFYINLSFILYNTKKKKKNIK